MFDPIELAELTQKEICRDRWRKYYRFRPSRFYGGIATADCVGCCLRCAFCWSWNVTTRPEYYGKLYSPEDVAQRLLGIAKKKGIRRLRISGNEPTLCREHLLEVLGLIPANFLFILETNGILIGKDPDYARQLAAFPNLVVRVSLKGTCEEEFSRLTGAVPEGYQLQLEALKNLRNHGVNCHPACMISFSPHKNIVALKKRLKAIDPVFKDFEVEELILYPPVLERLKKRNIRFLTGYGPGEIPPEQI
jgi:uncharacterized Fe-S cluster-containing radical SAM superfamily protein